MIQKDCATRSAGAAPGIACATAVLAGAWMLQGCATPSERADALGAAHGWQRTIESGADYRHVVYFNGIVDTVPPLHVYIEGDGSPYLDRWTVSPDPMPRDTVMLQLMTFDTGPAIYLGRPCYFGLAGDPPCNPQDWTLGRFSEAVVASLAAVVDEQRLKRGHHSVEIYGHSGGGALAVLLARRMDGVVRVVTLAGNLDTAAWARHHGYSPLVGSLDPLQGGPLPDAVAQLHLAGAEDDVVPPWMIMGALRRLDTAPPEVLPGVAHTCCWSERWKQLMSRTP